MTVSVPAIKNSIRQAIAVVLAVWLSGIIFIFCCEQAKAGVEPKDSCPMMKMGGHCDKVPAATDFSVDAQGSPDLCINCCGFLPVVFDKYRKAEKAQQKLAPPQTAIAVAFAVPVSKPALKPPPALAKVPYHTRILSKNCVLRI